MVYQLENYKILGVYQSFFSLPGLCVAIESSPGKFKAYGENILLKGEITSHIILKVAKYGMQLTKERATVIFSDIAENYTY